MYKYNFYYSDNKVRVIPMKNNLNITWKEVIGLFTDKNFIYSLVTTINGLNFQKYLWECPKVIMDNSFEFILIECDQLSNIANNTSFINEISNMNNKCSESISFFKSYTSSTLIVPRGVSNNTFSYSSLGPFLKYGQCTEIFELFECIASKLEEGKWLSTSGLAVPWLHVRIDDIPKYYRSEYKFTYFEVNISLITLK